MPLLPQKRVSRNYTDPHQPRHSLQDFEPLASAQHNSLKIVSYNIRYSKRVSKAIGLFLESPDLFDADIICLQEMDPRGVDLFAKTLKYNYVYYPAVLHPHHNRDFGNAILTRWSIHEDRKIILPNVPRQRLQRIAVCANIRIHEHHITVLNVHMKVFLKPHRRSDQVDFLTHAFSSLTKHTIIAGDFNTFSRSGHGAMVRAFERAQFTHATRDIGWTHKHPYLLQRKSSLDHIFSKGFRVEKTGKVTDRKASDHIPIWARLNLTESA